MRLFTLHLAFGEKYTDIASSSGPLELEQCRGQENFEPFSFFGGPRALDTKFGKVGDYGYCRRDFEREKTKGHFLLQLQDPRLFQSKPLTHEKTFLQAVSIPAANPLSTRNSSSFTVSRLHARFLCVTSFSVCLFCFSTMTTHIALCRLPFCLRFHFLAAAHLFGL